MESKQLNPLIEQFLDTIWLEQDLAENTLASYRNDLQSLDRWLDKQQLHLETVQSIDLQSFLAERIDGGYKAASSARLLSSIRRLFQYFYREKN